MHLHQPDWKSGEGTEDGSVHAGDHANGADASDERGSWNTYPRVE